MDFEYDVQPLEITSHRQFPDYQREVMTCLQKQEVTLRQEEKGKRSRTPFSLGLRGTGMSSGGSRNSTSRVKRLSQRKQLEAARKQAATEWITRMKLQVQLAAEKA